MGIGSALLRESMKAMKENYKAEEVYLEVRVSNEVAIICIERMDTKKLNY